MTQKSDSELVHLALAGDGDSFSELCRRYYCAMVAIADSILGDRHLAEDAAQQAFAKAAMELPRLRRTDRYGYWLTTICRNAARDIVRHRRLTYEPQVQRSQVSGAKDDAETEVVREAMTRLSASAREIIYLRFYDGLSYEQISAVLRVSKQAINGRLRRAKRELARYLRKSGYCEVTL